MNNKFIKIIFNCSRNPPHDCLHTFSNWRKIKLTLLFYVLCTVCTMRRRKTKSNFEKRRNYNNLQHTRDENLMQEHSSHWLWLIFIIIQYLPLSQELPLRMNDDYRIMLKSLIILIKVGRASLFTRRSL